MQKKIKIVIIILAILLVAGLGYWFGRDFVKEKATKKNQKWAVQQESEIQQLAGQGEQQAEIEQISQGSLMVSTVEIKESVDNYEIALKYPQISGISNALAMSAANSALKNKMQTLANNFKKDVASNDSKELSSKSVVTNVYELATFSNDVISIKFNIIYSIAGKNQPKNYEDSFNYNLKENKEIKLADLFNSGVNYLSKLSSICSDNINKQLEKTNYYSPAAISLGTTATESNFSNFVFTKNMLVVIINPGQVSPSTTSIRYIDIPWSNMAYINNNSELLKLITE